MKQISTFGLNTSILAIGLGLAVSPIIQANPTSQNGAQVDNISLSSPGINSNMIILKNTSANKHVNAVKITPESSNININLQGTVKCAKDKDVKFTHAEAYFGPVYMFVNTIQSPKALYEAGYAPSVTEWHGHLTGWITEGGNAQKFSVPLAQIKQGDADIRFDPVAELNKKLQTHLNQGGTKLSFYKQDQLIYVKRPISLVGWCKPGIQASTPGYKTIMADLVIKYEGDSKVTNVGVVNAQLQGGMPQQIDNALPFKLTNATFQPNMPHYIQQCGNINDPQIRVNFQGNGKGKIQFKIRDNLMTSIAYEGELDFDGKNNGGKAHYDFKYPLKAKLDQFQGWQQVNKTFNHPLKIIARVIDHKSNRWGGWKDYETKIWKHRCIPKVNAPTAGGNMGYQNGNQENPKGANTGILKKVAPDEPKSPLPIRTR
ncbi:MAG: hypothetical protein OEW89_09760 [Gammaproteobacteria bacterium]|nr:hypothetical protein [Gammaproteobacteria bacterium]MDH5593790.1 hypothetical protein [Gammaproteobacteria bacterium]MDH5613637.1 hypothetical protein [Gammaproteobacteria bacterium]